MSDKLQNVKLVYLFLIKYDISDIFQGMFSAINLIRPCKFYVNLWSSQLFTTFLEAKKVMTKNSRIRHSPFWTLWTSTVFAPRTIHNNKKARRDMMLNFQASQNNPKNLPVVVLLQGCVPLTRMGLIPVFVSGRQWGRSVAHGPAKKAPQLSAASFHHTVGKLECTCTSTNPRPTPRAEYVKLPLAWMYRRFIWIQLTEANPRDVE